MVYWLLTTVFGIALDLFYRRKHLEGAVPPKGPALLVANHPNGLVDPIMVTRIADRPVRSLAKAPLFKMPGIGFLVRSIGALPVYRRQDGFSGEKNDRTFEAVNKAFEAGELIAIFPEGTSHSDPELKPLKTGAARMALAAGVPIIPIGLLYRDKGIFRSEAGTIVGEPIIVESNDANDPEQVRQLTEEIDAGIRRVTINLERWEDLALLSFAEQIWRKDDKDPLARVGVLATGQRHFSQAEPERLQTLRTEVELFAAELALFGLTPARLDADYAPQRILRFVLRNLCALILGLPTALLGALAYAPPFQLVRQLVRLLKPKDDLLATYKMLGGLLFYPLWHALMIIALVAWVGVEVAAVSCFALPLAGLYALRFSQRRQAALREVLMFLKIGRRGALVASLRQRRDDLAAELDALEKLYDTETS